MRKQKGKATMKKQNIKASCLLLFLILFLQTNYFSSFAQTQEESLYKRLGEVYNIAAVVDDFVDRLLSDSLITTNKNVVTAMGKITKPGLKYQITEWFCQAAGGPQKYNGRSMKESHQGLNVTESEWQSMMKDFLATLAKFNIKGLEQNELLVIVGSTKSDIVAPASQATQPLAPALRNAPPSNAIPQPPVVPPSPTPLPLDLMNAPSIPAPGIPVVPSPKNTPPAPSSVNTPPQVPEIRVIPSPTNAPSPQVPGFPSPSAAAPNNIVPPKPSLELPLLPEAPDEAPSAEPEQGSDKESETTPSDLPQEPTLEPAEQ